MTLPENIPYNPSLKGIGFFLALTTATFAAGALSLFRPRLAFFTSAVFLSFASLLFLRRFVWRRHLTLTHDFLTVPSGFLRLRPTGIAYVHITRVWVARVFVTAVICVRTGDRQVEIQDMYLPDSATFNSLKRFLESVQSSRSGN